MRGVVVFHQTSCARFCGFSPSFDLSWGSRAVVMVASISSVIMQSGATVCRIFGGQ